MHIKLNDLHKRITRLKNVSPKTKNKEDLKAKVLEDAGDLYYFLCYIYKERYE